jgi:hypothetical protein
MGTITFHIQTTETAEHQAVAGVAPPLPVPVVTAARQLRHEIQCHLQTLAIRIWISAGIPFRIVVRDVPEPDRPYVAAAIERVLAAYPGWRYLIVRNEQISIQSR